MGWSWLTCMYCMYSTWTTLSLAGSGDGLELFLVYYTAGPPCHRCRWLDSLCPCQGWAGGIHRSFSWTSLSSMPLSSYSWFMSKMGWMNPQLIYLDLLVIDPVVKILSVHAKAGLEEFTDNLPGPPCHRCHCQVTFGPCLKWARHIHCLFTWTSL